MLWLTTPSYQTFPRRRPSPPLHPLIPFVGEVVYKFREFNYPNLTTSIAEYSAVVTVVSTRYLARLPGSPSPGKLTELMVSSNLFPRPYVWYNIDGQYILASNQLETERL